MNACSIKQDTAMLDNANIQLKYFSSAWKQVVYIPIKQVI